MSSRTMFAVLIGLLIGMLLSPAPASADGGFVDSAHRMAVALERIATTLEGQAHR